MILTLANGYCLADADDVTDQAGAEGHGPRPKWLRFLWRRISPLQPLAQRPVDYLFEALFFGTPKPVEGGRDIVVDRQRRSHASRHKIVDVLMQHTGLHSQG
jgi:hypothetical protein